MHSSITRRNALKTLAGAATLASLPAAARGADTPAPNGLNQSVCRWCFNKTPLDELCRQVKAIGLHSVELLGPEEWPVAIQHGLTCAVAMGHSTIPDGFNRVENHEQVQIDRA